MSHIVKVKVECINTNRLLAELMRNKSQILESIIRLEILTNQKSVEFSSDSILATLRFRSKIKISQANYLKLRSKRSYSTMKKYLLSSTFRSQINKIYLIFQNQFDC